MNKPNQQQIDREDQIAANWQALIDAGHTSKQIAKRELAKQTGKGNAPRVDPETEASVFLNDPEPREYDQTEDSL